MVSHRSFAMPVDAGVTPEPTVKVRMGEGLTGTECAVICLMIHMLLWYVLFALQMIHTA
jgi:hypothetical protein